MLVMYMQSSCTYCICMSVRVCMAGDLVPAAGGGAFFSHVVLAWSAHSCIGALVGQDNSCFVSDII